MLLLVAFPEQHLSCTLNNNNITRIPVTSFNHMPKIRTLRLHSNFLHCDCHLAWLSDWLRQRRTIGQFTFCLAPVGLRGFLVAEPESPKALSYGYTDWLMEIQ
ncbi:hypothetical protein EK904_002214 [Melospiza melodia maxima]|nr:hypothetical protein EK904_002214 [Melospiza melodia maxima]